jgi:hypothetical protein
MKIVQLPTPELTPLERELLERIYARYKDWGFPAVDALRVTSRENTGAGRFTYLDHDGTLAFDGDGDLGQGDYSYFDMEGLDAGANFCAYIKGRKVLHLEIATGSSIWDEAKRRYRGAWDGIERPWRVCDPDGTFPEMG